MRHRKKFNHLGRKKAHRKSMIANMASSLILHKRIKTTLAKAKALRTYVEPLITRSKEDTTHSRRMVFRVLQNKDAVTELFREVSTKVADRPGGYTRIIKLGPRMGDNAEMALIELVDFNEHLLEEKAAAKAKTTRRGRRGAKKKTEEAVAAEKVEEAVSDTTEEAAEEVAEEPVAEAESTTEAAVETPAAEEEKAPEAVADEQLAPETAPEKPSEEKPAAEATAPEDASKETPAETSAEKEKEPEEESGEKKDTEDTKS